MIASLYYTLNDAPTTLTDIFRVQHRSLAGDQLSPCDLPHRPIERLVYDLDEYGKSSYRFKCMFLYPYLRLQAPETKNRSPGQVSHSHAYVLFRWYLTSVRKNIATVVGGAVSRAGSSLLLLSKLSVAFEPVGGIIPSSRSTHSAPKFMEK